MFGGRMRAEPELARTMHVRRPEDLWAAWSMLAPLFGWTSLPWLWTIRHPALVLCGDDDPIAPHLNHRILAALIPRGRLHTIRGGGHLVLLDSPSRVAPVISGFLGAGARQSAGRAA
jgi:pimeloyl-ACP methyl ester carboxylesterase